MFTFNYSCRNQYKLKSGLIFVTQVNAVTCSDINYSKVSKKPLTLVPGVRSWKG